MSDNFDATAIVGGAGRPLVLKDRYEVERELGRGGMSVVYNGTFRPSSTLRQK